MKTLLFALILVTGFSFCNTKKTQMDELTALGNVEIDQSSNEDKWNSLIKNRELGALSAGDSLESAIKLIRKYFSVKQIHKGESDFYTVYNQNKERIFNIYPGNTDSTLSIVEKVEVFLPGFATDNGMKIGDSVGELKQKCEINEIAFRENEGLCFNIDGFDGLFVVSKEQIKSSGIPDISVLPHDSIPSHLIIDKIVLL